MVARHLSVPDIDVHVDLMATRHLKVWYKFRSNGDVKYIVSRIVTRHLNAWYRCRPNGCPTLNACIVTRTLLLYIESNLVWVMSEGCCIYLVDTV